MANEKRLIDVNARIEEIRKAHCTNCDNYDGVRCRSCWVDDGIGFLEDAPTVDAVEVVRCKECKFYELKYYPDNTKAMTCENSKAIWTRTPPDAFCSYGERRIENA